MEIIEQIGSYAGLAAIVGLALLSALYFSQARDVRRLREGEEGRAADAAPAEQAQARGPKRPTAAVVPGQGEPAGAEAEESGQPAAAASGRAAPVAAGEESNGKDEKASARAAAGSTAPAASAAVASANAGGGQAAPAETQVGAPPVERGNVARPSPQPTPRLPPPRPGATAAALRSASSPSSSPPTPTARQPWYRALPARYLALIVAGIVVLSAGAVYAFAALIGEGGADSGGSVASEEAGGSEGAGGGEGAAPLDPSTITVAVLNGTEVAGLAGQIADSVEAAGFQRGNVSNAPQQGGTAESAVLFADGAERAARQVGQELGISQIEPIDEQSRTLAGTADVVVVVGADQGD
jgi:LytR cell envelope-related transcriptional attenuator